VKRGGRNKEDRVLNIREMPAAEGGRYKKKGKRCRLECFMTTCMSWDGEAAGREKKKKTGK